MTMPQGASGLEGEAWMSQWVMTPTPANAVTVSPPTPPGASGASGASGGAGATPAFETFAITTDSLSDLTNRTQENVNSYYQATLPILNAWELAGNALYNVLMGGFNSIENFLEILVEAILGRDVELNFLTDGVKFLIETIGNVVGPIIRVLSEVWENIGEPIIEAIFGFLGWLWELFDSIIGKPAREILEDVFSFLFRLWDNVGDFFESLLEPALGFLAGLWDVAGDVLEDIFEFIVGVWNGVGRPIVEAIWGFILGVWEVGEDVVEGIWNFILGAWTDIGEPILQAIFGTLAGIWNVFDQVVIDNIIQFFRNLTDNNNLIDVLEDVANFFYDVIADFGSIIAGIPLVSTITQWIVELVRALTGNVFVETIVAGIQTVVGWVTQIPIIGAILSAIIPDEWENTTGNPASSIADLKEYSSELVNTSTALNTQNLYGEIPADLLPVVPPGFVGDTRPNLVADAGFRSAATVQAGSGWSWDQSVTRSDGDGGSAKVVGDGGVKQMFSNMVAVSAGQSLEVGVYARWTKPSAARPTISVGLRGYNNEDVVFTQAVASKTNVVTNSASFAGNVSGWVSLSGTYDIPSSVTLTHVRLVLSVLNAPASTSVWFDDASLKKVSLIGQELVQGSSPGSNLADDIENSVGFDSYQALLDRVAKKTGASLADVQATIDDFLDGDSTVSGDQIRAGNIASEYINELIDTWAKINGGIGGATATATGTLDSAFQALSGWRTAIADAGSQALGATSTASNALNRAINLETQYAGLLDYVSKMATDVRNAVIQVGGTPTTPATPPGQTPVQFREASDNFDRTGALGSAWSTGIKFSNAGAFLLDGNSAYFEAPAVTNVFTVGAAIHTGAGSATNFQRVYLVLSSKAGLPLLSSTRGYNDLIGRAVSPTQCVVARFFADGKVRLFYRSGGWESDPQSPSNVFGSFNLPAQPTSGSILEFYVGSRARSDQTLCSVKFGSWTSGNFAIPSSVLSTMGNRWGWGGGNGISEFVVAQQSGRVNFWGAQDQS